MAAMLSEHAGGVECGTVVGDPLIEESIIKERLRKRHASWEKSRFEDYWEMLMEDLFKEPAPDVRIKTR